MTSQTRSPSGSSSIIPVVPSQTLASNASSKVPSSLPSPPDNDWIQNFKHALSNGDITNLERLLPNYPDINECRLAGTYKNGKPYIQTPLQYICDTKPEDIKTQITVIEWLLEHGASPNSPDSAGPMHYSAKHNNVSAAALLLQHGAGLTLKDSIGYTLIHYAVAYRALEMVEFLLDHGVSLNSRDRDERTPMHLAARFNNVPIAALLLQRGGDIDDLKNRWGETPLHRAVSYGALGTVKFFLENGASTTSLTPKGGTLADIHFQKEGWHGKPISESTRLHIRKLLALREVIEQGSRPQSRGEPYEQLSNILEQANLQTDGLAIIRLRSTVKSNCRKSVIAEINGLSDSETEDDEEFFDAVDAREVAVALILPT
jgi:ankyrin repeat protein